MRNAKRGAVATHYAFGWLSAKMGYTKHPSDIDRPSFNAGWQRYVRRKDLRRMARLKRHFAKQEAHCAAP